MIKFICVACVYSIGGFFIWFLTNATSSAIIALGLSGVSIDCDRCEYEVVPKVIEDHKIVKQVSRDALTAVIQDTVKRGFCLKAFFANIVMACHGFGRGVSSIMIVCYPVTVGPEEGSEDVLEGS